MALRVGGFGGRRFRGNVARTSRPLHGCLRGGGAAGGSLGVPALGSSARPRGSRAPPRARPAGWARHRSSEGQRVKSEARLDSAPRADVQTAPRAGPEPVGTTHATEHARTVVSPPDAQARAPPSEAGRVALVGRPNVGEKHAPQRPRRAAARDHEPPPPDDARANPRRLHRASVQLVFSDTPGIHDARTALGTFMNQEAETRRSAGTSSSW